MPDRPIPRRLRDVADRRWLAELPARIAECERILGVRAGRPFPGASCAWVAPAGPHAVLKVGFPHHEAEHEADALDAWSGRGAVRLLSRVPEHNALLVERCVPGTRLRLAGSDEIFRVSVELLTTLWDTSAALDHPFAQLEDELARRAADLRATEMPLAADAAAIFDELPPSAASRTLIHGDFHPDNVLASSRDQWLAIDPKPMFGDVAFDTAQWLLNLPALDRPSAVRFAKSLGLDPSRVCDYTWARLVEESLDDEARRFTG